MFGNLFGSKKPVQPPSHPDPAAAALVDAVRARSKEDPFVGAKVGAKEVFQRVLVGLKDAKGVHIESLLVALGALAGYACQASLRAQALIKGLPPDSPFHVVGTKDGKRYYFGDPLNNLLAGDQHSVWSVVGGAAQHAGASEFPDLNEIFQHTSTVLGSDQFGVPRMPDGKNAGDLPASYLKALWPHLFPTVKLLCPDPAHWPLLFGLAVQEAVYAGKEAIDPGVAFRIVMESAVPMSKIDLSSH